MGLTTALSTALTGLKVSQQSMAVLAQNISNANNPKYTRQTAAQSALTTGDIAGSGVRLDEVTRVADQFVNKGVITHNSLVSQADIINSYYQQSQILIGQPGQSNSIDSYTQSFFNSLNTLSNDTENSSIKQSAVSAATNLASAISTLAKGVEDLRFQADGQIATSVTNVNNIIAKIFELNTAIGNAHNLGQNTNGISDEIDNQLALLSTEVNVQYSFNEFGQVAVSTGNGATLVEGANHYQLSYEPATSVQSLIDDTPSTPIKVMRVKSDGSIDTSSSFNLVSGGNKGDVTSSLTGGKIQGLLQLRDTLLPKITDQLDNFSATLRDQVNAIYNQGTSYPPPTSITGTTLVNPSELSYWNGSITIAALKTGSSTIDGQPATSPYASEDGLKPLTINLGALTDAAGAAGTVTFQSIIDEINNYYGTPQNKTSLGAISNMELIAKSDSLTAGSGSFNFNLETTNLTADTRNYTITGITASDANIVVTAPATFPTSALTSTAGATELASPTNFSLDMSSSLVGAGPYTIDVAVSVDDGAGGFYTDTITYTITEAQANLMNDRFAASAVSGTGDATIESPTTNQPALAASLVDANGREIAKDPVSGKYTAAGYLKISGASGNGVGVLQVDSAQLGTQSKSTPTNYGFSQYFGLNNFFETGNGTNRSQVADAAITLKVRDDIAKTPGSISVGALRLSAQPSATGSLPRYTYEITAGNNDTVLKMNSLSSSPVTFAAAGGISRTSVSFNNYASQILGFNAAVSSAATDSLNKETLIYQGYVAKKDSVGGVNVDEEIANTITFQNAYTANARVISVIKAMFDSLIQAF